MTIINKDNQLCKYVHKDRLVIRNESKLLSSDWVVVFDAETGRIRHYDYQYISLFKLLIIPRTIADIEEFRKELEDNHPLKSNHTIWPFIGQLKNDGLVVNSIGNQNSNSSIFDSKKIDARYHPASSPFYISLSIQDDDKLFNRIINQAINSGVFEFSISVDKLTPGIQEYIAGFEKQISIKLNYNESAKCNLFCQSSNSTVFHTLTSLLLPNPFAEFSSLDGFNAPKNNQSDTILTPSEFYKMGTVLSPNMCQAGITHCAIDSKGIVYPCIEAFGIPELEMGDINKESLSEIWESSKWSFFRGGWDLYELKNCYNCKRYMNCQLRRCRVQPLKTTNDKLGTMPSCDFHVDAESSSA